MLLCKEGQTEENDMYGNLDDDGPWRDFLDLIGTRLTLQGYDRYSAQACLRWLLSSCLFFFLAAVTLAT